MKRPPTPFRLFRLSTPVTAFALLGAWVFNAQASEAFRQESDEASKSRIYGGEAVKTCEWPSTIGFGNCTGTLIHPNVVIYAAHCGRQSKIILGDNYRGGVAKKIPVKFCKTNPKFFGIGRGTDYAFCYLEKAITDVPIAPIAYGCELDQIKAGADIWLVGFGEIDSGSSGTKYKVQTKVNKLLLKGAEVNVGGNGKATCYGDSGGPAFIQLSDGSWRTFGITSYGSQSACGYPSGMTMANIAVPWIHKELKAAGINDVDITPCYDDDGTWAPSEACTGFPLELGTGFGSWSQSCSKGAKLSGASTICATTKDKKPPSVEILGLDDGESVDANEELEIRAKAKDDSGLPVQITPVFDGEKLETLNKSPYKWTVSAGKPGKVSIYLIAEDASGNESKSDKIKIRVLESDDNSDEEDSESSSVESGDDSSSEDTQDQDNDDSDGDSDASSSEEPNDDEATEDESGGPGGGAAAIPGTGGKGNRGCSVGASPPMSALLWSFVILLASGSRRRRKTGFRSRTRDR